MKPVAEQIRAEIARLGAISFARFMELALYCPHCGYYEKKEDTPGKRGDFFTSVSVGPLFGELLAFQFAEWLDQSGVWSLESEVQSPKSKVQSPGSAAAGPIAEFQIVEAGAHDGRLATDILNWLKLRRPTLVERLEYWIVEPSDRRREWQRETLKEFDTQVRWFADLNAVAPRTICGVVFSNELLDAMPVQRVGWDSKRRAWFEWGVTVDQDRFVWTRLHDTNPGPDFVRLAPSSVLEHLPDGFTIDCSRASARWWMESARLLRCGKLLTLDYGMDAEDFIAPQRANGTLRAYHRHRLVEDVLVNPGEQDITAHVNFTAIQRAGETAGLRTQSAGSQAQFLTGIAQRAWQAGSGFGPWTKERTRQFQTLTHPEHLGRAFRVLVQSRAG